MRNDQRTADRVLILAPTGRDGAVLCDILGREGFVCEAHEDLRSIIRDLPYAGTAVIAEEAITHQEEAHFLEEWLAVQPPWSDFPFVLLVFGEADRELRSFDLRDLLQNVTLLERPLHPDTISKAVGAACRARRRQLEAAQLLEARTRAEQQRRLGEERLRELFENAADAILIAGSENSIIEANPAACNLLGLQKNAMVGKQISALIDPSDEPKLSRLRDAVPYEANDFSEWRFKHANGTWIDTEVSSCILKDGRLLSFVRDIGARKRAETALRQVNETLERRVEERTAKMIEAQEALAQAQKMEAIGQLTGGVAHDFNNLLMVMSGGLEMLKRRPDKEDQHRLIGHMQNALDRGSAITRQLLTVARRQAMNPMPTFIDRRIGAMAELLDHSLRGDIRLEMQFPADLWPVNVDPTQLDVAVLNAAVNARDAMPDGGILRICAVNTAQVRFRSKTGDFVKLEVADTGSGMSAEVQARVFEPFFTTKDVGKGSGLGLAQIYAFCEQSGGVVEIDSELGRGTTISMYLPRSCGYEQNLQDLPVEKSEPVTSLKGATVLLVEDDDEVAALAADMIDQLGYQVIRAATAAAALGALANERKIDLVFSDILMPGGMSGADLAGEIMRRRPDLPVVLATGYDGQSLTAAEKLGLPLLRKPYRLNELSVALATALAST